MSALWALMTLFPVRKKDMEGWGGHCSKHLWLCFYFYLFIYLFIYFVAVFLKGRIEGMF